ncbi:RNA pyrophosphohydrolase [Wolbachia pipientis]|uniref:RNA pyrophosphohydrolase n=1 Tax=Wolbachia pipientis TaxID=955 RepID=A0A1E7QKH5_WOLPI|nr:RNA pyrophosphohydrolase [Wolbachia pipientis]OEY86953.1 RNA pyrophosphohydrolase [Wolbachia pipientis]
MSIKIKKNYRTGVGIVLFNNQGNIFTGKRFDADLYWQMPQGGIDENESLEQAALRELLEETGIGKVEIITQSKNWLYYDIPKTMVPLSWNNAYLGQQQKWFLMKFLGTDEDVNINYIDNAEFKEWCWQSADNVLSNVISFKKELYTLIIKEFSHVIRYYVK